MPAFVLQQVSSNFARANCKRTLDKHVGIQLIAKYLDEATLKVLNEMCPDGGVYIWGAKYERSHQFVKMPELDSIVFFRRERTIFALGVIVATTVSKPLGETLWGHDEGGETWPLIYFLKRLRRVNQLASEINPLLGRNPHDNWQGLVALTVPESPELRYRLACQA